VGLKEPKKMLFPATHRKTAAGIQYYNSDTSAQLTQSLCLLYRTSLTLGAYVRKIGSCMRIVITIKHVFIIEARVFFL
jgi:hypothetical protein